MTVGLTKMVIFGNFDGYFFRSFRLRPALLCGDKRSFAGFYLIAKRMTLSSYFMSNSVFMPAV